MESYLWKVFAAFPIKRISMESEDSYFKQVHIFRMYFAS